MADRPEDAVALSDDDLEELAAEPSEHHLEPANREDDTSTEATDDELPRPTPRSRKKGKGATATRQKGKPAVTDETTVEREEDAEEEVDATRQTEADEREEARLRTEEGLDEEEELTPVIDEPKPGKPFRFKASGAEQTFNGLEELEDGSFKGTPEAATVLRGLLASHIELRRTSTEERRRLTRELNSAKGDQSAREIEADKIASIFEGLIKLQSEDEVFQWATDFLKKIPDHKAAIKEAQLAAREKALEARAKGPELLPEEEEERFDNAVQGELGVTFERLFKLPEAKFLTPEDRTWLQGRWQNRGKMLVSKQGTETIFDDQLVVDDFIDRVKIRQQNANLLKTRQQNEQRNGDRPATETSPIPPSVRSGRRPSTGGEQKRKEYGRGQKRDFKKAFMKGDLDVQDED